MAHRHTDSCYRSRLNCAKVEHSHNARACYFQRGDKEGQLKCHLGEHSHGSNCYTAIGPICGN